MNIFPSFMGRRQFLIAAGTASTLGLGFKKITGVFNPRIQRGIALAADNPGAAGIKGVYSDRYSHILSPLKIGNVVLKNRLMQADSYPFCMQGPESFPSEQVISWYANVVKNGCAIVMCTKGGERLTGKGESEMIEVTEEEMKERGVSEEQIPGGSHARTPIWDKSDARVQSYFAQMTDAIHFYGSKAALLLHNHMDDEGHSIGNVEVRYDAWTEKTEIKPGKEIPIELMQKGIEKIVEEAKFYQALGFDMVHFHMSYRSSFLAHVLSSISNTRTDKYGGSLENRARLPLEIFQAIKKACGQDFLVGAHISGEEMQGGYTVQDASEYAKIWEDALDILVVRGKDQDVSHACGLSFKKDENPIIDYARVIKEGGTKLAVVPNGGFRDLDLNEEYIASGKADMISMARTWWVDPEYGKKAYEGRGEDVVPCVMCNDCHGLQGPPLSFCTVNPEFGHAHRMNRMIDAPVVSRKVAVIGGGPAGMKAALTAFERGHKVTLYERNDYLGGQLKHTDYVSFKWPYKDFKDYLIRQVNKSGIVVHLSTRATPEIIKKKGYDVVLVAAGAEPIIPDIPGAKGGNVLSPIFAYGNKTLGKNIVIIGGDQIGTETGMHLAEIGHNVTVMTSEDRLATDANGIYLYPTRWKHLKTFGSITEVTATGISEGKVTYVDAKGNEKSIRADSVVINAGRKPRQEEAMKFYGSAKRFFLIGDCGDDGGNVRKSQRTAFAAASQI